MASPDCRATQAPLEQEWDEALGAAHVRLERLAQGRNQRGFLNGYAVCIGNSHAGRNYEERRFPTARPSSNLEEVKPANKRKAIAS